MQRVDPQLKSLSPGGRLRSAAAVFLSGCSLPVGAWLLYTIGLPIFDVLTGGTQFAPLSSLGVLLQLSAVLFALGRAWPLSRLIDVVGLAVPLTWAAEWLGSTTGFPFGPYHYTDALQPQLLGVPALIPLAWLMMLPPAWAVAAAVVSPRERAPFALVAALAFTAWDLYLDPQMVARGLWVWDTTGTGPLASYFGIPWVNFLGWVLTAFVVTFVCAPRDLPGRPLAVVYTLTWLLQAIGLGVFWGQPGPALVGLVVMGVFVALYWRTELRNTASAGGG